ncbi:hypothetical protein H5410_023511 [Solanum commersonii]|uniref:SWIM-type domain-containing protein n=1 Tax=Solanum commersonii TaxID=4109 RepID=A0A9J5ZK31_SOLCO|nr:hypothetical protein H5410_023511 [Solanum commersonii]
MEVFARHLIDEAIVGPMLIENGSHVVMGESGSAFNTRSSESENFNFGVDVGPAGPDFSEEEVEGSDYSTEDSVESKVELVGDNDEESEAGLDLGFDETETGKVSYEGRLGDDEPYFASFDEDSFKLDKDECCNDDEHESGRLRRGMSIAITNVLPKCEHRMCARHILANWAKDWRGLQRRQQFWKCKVYFNTEVKCDSIDNNMSECFNAWILVARHKTIITMLEEIRVKMMTKIAKLREFPITWKCNFSPMALKVLEVNISRSMDCTIEFNGVAGFKVKEGLCQHKIDIAKRTCSCRVWQLRGILCAHVVDALYFKKFSLYDYINSCYSKETYLRIYANVIEPLTNMEMWLVFTNPTIEPPEITNMPGRPPKARRKEVG